jgi:hypothetical protein
MLLLVLGLMFAICLLDADLHMLLPLLLLRAWLWLPGLLLLLLLP